MACILYEYLYRKNKKSPLFLHFLLTGGSEMTSQRFPRIVKEGGFDKRLAATSLFGEMVFKRIVIWLLKR